MLEDPYLCSPFLSQIFKSAVPSWCRLIVQEWPSNHWARHRLLETDRQHPHPWGFPTHHGDWVGKWIRIALKFGSLNVRGLRDLRKCACLLGDLSKFCENLAAVQQTRFTCAEDCWMLQGDFVVFSAFGSRCGVGVSLLVGCSLNANVNLIFAGDESRLVAADVAVKTFEFRVVAVYAPKATGERRSFFRQLEPFLDD